MNRLANLSEQLKLTLVISRDEASPKNIMDLAEEAFAGGVTALQLREKKMADGQLYNEAKELKNFCHHHGKMLIINDRVDIALAIDADGVHLGQADLPVAAAAGLLPKNKILGVSANITESARLAIAAGADYLGVGAIFPTISKDDVSAVSLAEIKSIIDLGIPAVAIGGINAENANSVWQLGFCGLAVISALSMAEDPKAVAAKIIAAR